LTSASEGDTVLVEGPRTFKEHIVVTSTVHLIGTNTPVIDGEGIGTPLTLGAAGASASGLVVRNSGHDLTKLDSGIRLNADGVSVRDCRVENDGFGIYLRGVNNCQIERNEVLGSGSVTASVCGNGIHLWKAQRNRIVGNTVRRKRDGLYFSYADYN